MTALSVAAIFGRGGEAAVFTYSLSSYPSLQDGGTLSGSITVDTGAAVPDAQGNYFVGHSSITAWSFSITPGSGTGIAAYGRSSADINAQVSGSGGNAALYATATTLSVVSSGSLRLDADLVAGLTQTLTWVDDVSGASSYATSNGVASAWQTTDDVLLDTTFPSNGDAGAANWVMATAVPEPSTMAMLAAGTVATLLIAGRQRRSRMRAAVTA